VVCNILYAHEKACVFRRFSACVVLCYGAKLTSHNWFYVALSKGHLVLLLQNKLFRERRGPEAALNMVQSVHLRSVDRKTGRLTVRTGHLSEQVSGRLSTEQLEADAFFMLARASWLFS